MARSGPRWTRVLAWRLEALGYDLASALVRRLPVDAASAMGGAILRRLGPLTRAHETARLGLMIAYPDMPPADRRRILAAQWDNFGRYVAEFPLTDRLTPGGGRVVVDGADRLAKIAASGQPTIFISGHFSHFEVMPAVIVHAGITCDMTYRPANNPFVDARIKDSRFRYGVRLFAPKGAEGARDLLTALAEGRSIALLNDQRYDAGVAGRFFGHEVMTNPVAARLALRFGAPIQPMSIQRLRGARFRCVVHEPIIARDTGNRTADIATTVAAINAFLEARVRERPGDWWWLHRRWPKAAYEPAREERSA